MMSTSYSVGGGKMIMRGGCDTGYSISGSSILKGGCYTDLSIDNAGKIKKGGSDTGYVVGGGGSIMKDSDKGFNIDWMFK